MNAPYCISRFQSVRRRAREVSIGPVKLGGDQPVRVQSMTTTPTQDVAATVAQSIRLAEAGCEIVRITAQNVKAAEALKDIRAGFSAAGFAAVPLVADIHFLPKAAMEAVKWVEKVRVNPGNYADKKKFDQRAYTDAEYQEELERLHEAFSPLVRRCKELGRAMRIGTNHGSLSDRIMNRYGDTPLGMAESAMEFLRIAESHGYHQIVLSMKASNPKVMVQAYRLIVAKMDAEGMHYPLHLGVTEAGDGDDARIKSAIGIGSLLYDGLGDTIRVSLTEDPVAEVPVAQALARKIERLWQTGANRTTPDSIDPYIYTRRPVAEVALGAVKTVKMGPLEPPVVIQPSPRPLSDAAPDILLSVRALQARLKEAPIEGLLFTVATAEDAARAISLAPQLQDSVSFCVWGWQRPLSDLADFSGIPAGDVLLLAPSQPADLSQALDWAEATRGYVAVDAAPEQLADLARALNERATTRLIFTCSASSEGVHPIGTYRQLAEALTWLKLPAPIWIRNTTATAVDPQGYFGDQLIEASILTGGLLCDGVGDFVSVETVADPLQSTTLAYNILQGARARTTKTEYVACPSCGRTLFDLQTTTQKVRAATGHLRGVTIAVMGCIVNGPGEMADADFGYVGGAPGKINLYVGKECVKFHIPSERAVEELVELIKAHDKWREPDSAA